MNRDLYFGDNIEVLREHINDETVDLIYLDPPFNSKRSFNLLFKSPTGHESDAQITAFEDSWHWGNQAEKEFGEILNNPNTDVAELIQSFRSFLHENDVMAYLVMMANRLLELHRVLKPNGSIYLHCDSTAGHYLKILMDGVFGKENFRNEIVWKRTNVHSDSKTWSITSDTIFFYTKSDHFTWNPLYGEHSEAYLSTKYRYDDNDGKGIYRLGDMTSPNPRPNMMYAWKGFPSPDKGWRYELETMKRLDAEGRIWYPTAKDGSLDFTRRPQLKRYLNEMPGRLFDNVWTDIPPINSQAQERLGYPTQKPLPLLERIIKASSNEGDLILDPFCGCGTAVHAAENNKRRWIGIDITHLAISLIEKRLKDAYPEISYVVHGTPKDIEGAVKLADLNKHQFQWWACSLISAHPYKGKRKGPDSGIDGLIWFQDDNKGTKKIVVSVKGGENVDVSMVRDLKGVIERENAELGFFVTLAKPTKPMVTEAASAGFYHSESYKEDWPKIQILTIEGLLNHSEMPVYKSVNPSIGFGKIRREITAHSGHVEMNLEG